MYATQLLQIAIIVGNTLHIYISLPIIIPVIDITTTTMPNQLRSIDV